MNYQGRHICLIIDKTTRVIESEIKDGKVIIHHKFAVDTSDFCDGKTISNVQKIVSILCSEFTAKNLWSHKVLIISNCLGVESQLTQAPISDVPWYKQDVSQFISTHKKNENEMYYESKINLGKCIVHGEKRSMRFSATIERALSNSIYNLFAKKGYRVLSLDSPDCAILAWRSLGAESYDENGKVIIHIGETSAKAYWCIGDVPVEEKTWMFSASEELAYQIESYISRDLIALKLRNPKVIFASNAFPHYSNLYSYLTDSGLNVLDLRQFISGDTMINASDALLISCLFKVYNKHNPMLVVQKKIVNSDDIVKKYKLFYSSSILLVTFSISILGFCSNEYFAQRKIIELSPKELEVQSAEDKLSNLEARTILLSGLSSRLNSLVTFVCQYPDIFVASIDTSEMLPQTIVENGDITIAESLLNASSPPIEQQPSQETSPDDIVAQPSIDEQPTQPQQNKIVVRGYSFSADVITKLLNNLKNNSEYNVYTLNGISKIPNSALYAFEIEVIE